MFFSQLRIILIFYLICDIVFSAFKSQDFLIILAIHLFHEQITQNLSHSFNTHDKYTHNQSLWPNPEN